MSTLTASGAVGNDAVRSIQVPPNWSVTLYSNSGFGGTAQTLTADSSDLGSFSAQTSSLIVIPG